MKTKKITKTVVLLIFLLPGSARLYAQGKPVAPTPPTRTIDAKGLSPRTANLLLDLEEAQQQGLDKRTAALEHIQGRHGLMEKNGQLYVYVFIHTQGAVDLAHYGVLYNPRRARGNLIRGHIPVSNLKSLSEDPAVRQVELGSPMKIKLDAARTTTRVDQVHAGAGLPGSFMGDGVVVGIIDLGMDYTHPTFFDETGTGGYRIKRVWEQQATEGTPPSGYDYGAEYTAEAEILAAQNDFELATDSDGIFPHATHVAGIAAGSGGGLADYRGVAPQSEIVYVAVDMNSNLALIDGVEYIFDYAASVNKPCVINMSLGDHTGPHDGTSSLDKAFDQLAGAGRILVGSAGNEGKFRLHQNKTFSPGDDQLYSFVDFLPDYEGDSTTIDIWGTPGHAYEVVLHLYDPESDLIVASTAIVTSNSSSTQQFELQDPQSQDVVSVTMAMEENNLNNDKPHTYIELDHSTDEANFLPVLLDVRATSGSVDMWTADNCEFLARDKP
ncbi:MAG: S8 family serine peptidase, partial [Sphingobacteriia bacterium]